MSRVRFVALAAVCAAVLPGCDFASPKAPTIEVGPTAIASGGYEKEFAAAAVEPSAKCPNGSLAVSSWNGQYFSPLTIEGQAKPAPGRGAAYPESAGDPIIYGGDPAMARYPNGDLLLAMASHEGSFGAPVPAYAADGTQSPTDEKQYRAGYKNRAREQMMISKDCGATWQAFADIDANKVSNGECAVPVWGDRTFKPPLKPSPGYVYKSIDTAGFDRSEIAIDPWTSTAYHITSCVGGVLTDGVQTSIRYESRLFRLSPGGFAQKTWQTMPDHVWDSTGARVLTTTADGGLWAAYCDGGKPYVRYSPDKGEHFEPATNVGDPNIAAPHEDCKGVASKDLAANQLVLAGGIDLSLARATPHGVRIVYPRGGSLITAFVDHHNGALHASQWKTIETTAGYSAITPTFIERTDPELEKAPNNVALLYWLESSNVTGYAFLRYSVVTNHADYTKPFTLDGPWKVKLTTAPDDPWAGDYMNGGYYCQGGETTFLPVWPETPSTATGPALDIMTARVNTHHKCKESSFAQALPTTTTSSSTSSTSSSTSSSTTSSSAVPQSTTAPKPSSSTTAGPTTTLAPARIKAVSLNMDTCTQTDTGKWKCGFGYAFQFQPGSGGYVTWSVDGSLAPACDGTASPYSADQQIFWEDTYKSQSGYWYLTFDKPPNPSVVYGQPGHPSTAKIHATFNGATTDTPYQNFFSDDAECGKP